MTGTPEHHNPDGRSPFEQLLEDTQLVALAREPLPLHAGKVNTFCDHIAQMYCTPAELDIDDLSKRVSELSLSFSHCVQEVLEEGLIFSADRDEAQAAIEPFVGLLLGELLERKKLLASLTGCDDFLGSQQFKLSADNLKDNDLIPTFAIQLSDKFIRKKPEKTAARLFDDYVADLLVDLNHLKDHLQKSTSQTDVAFTVKLVRTSGISFDLEGTTDLNSVPREEEENLYTTYSFTLEPPIKFYNRKKLGAFGITLIAKDNNRLYGEVRSLVAWGADGELDEEASQSRAAHALRPLISPLNQAVLIQGEETDR